MVEFTREDVEKITETYTIVKDLKEELEKGYSACTKCIEDHEDRLRKIEDWKSERIGEARVGAAAGGVTGAAVGGLIWVLTKLFGG